MSQSPVMKDDYAQLYQQFHWQVPEVFNIAQACCQRWAQATPNNTALICEQADSTSVKTYNFAQLQAAANQLSAQFLAWNVRRGDRVAVVLPQRFETAVAHMAVLQMGSVSVPLSFLFGPQALLHRLMDSYASVVICDETSLPSVQAALSEFDIPPQVILVGKAQDQLPSMAKTMAKPHRWMCWDDIMRKQVSHAPHTRTLKHDPAILIYTSGTTGLPKGALIAHQALLGNLPGFVASQNWYPQAGDVFWSPADWAWTGGLMDALLPSLYFGQPIVGSIGRFSPEVAFDLMVRHGVTNTFLFPTALKSMMRSNLTAAQHGKLQLRAIMSAGEVVGDAVFDYCQQELGVTVNEMFGQTEVNYILGGSYQRWPARKGSMGRPYPGHQVAVIDEQGQPLPAGQEGHIALNRYDIHGHPDPVMFLGYWHKDSATQEKFSGNWCRTGDHGVMDEQGYFWYRGRSDDMFKVAGYRVGPSDIEACLMQHRAVLNVAVVPKPDAQRGAVVKAYVVLAPTVVASQDLIVQLQEHVKHQLAAYEYPKEIEFIDALPMTESGKVRRAELRKREAQKAAGNR